MMRRQVGQYGGGDSGVGNAYAAAPMHHHMRGQRVEHKPSHFEERLEAFTPERDNSYGTSKPEGQWRWEGDGSKGSNPMATSQMFNEGQGGDTSRSYFQGQRPDPKLGLEKQSNNDSRSQPHIEDMDRGYEDRPSSQTFEDLEQKFLDDIRKVVQEQCDAEDKEISRHREKIGAINGQYEEQLTALRARHAKRRDELLRRESNARQQQYQQTVINRYPNSSMVPSDLHGYSGVAASATVEPHGGYNTDQYESYSERARFLGSSRDHGFEPRGPYPGGRVYDTGSRYY